MSRPALSDERRELWGEVGEQAGAIDTAVYEAVASTSTPVLDRALARISDLADFSKPWLAIAAVLALFGGSRGRRAAAEGAASVGLAATLVNLVVKPLTVRGRPERGREDRPFPRERYVRMPRSTSFPSGHTASAFAFSSAVGARIPLLWVPLKLLALLVAYSRVHTGVHYPGDVVAGALIGSGCAKAAAALARQRSRAPAEP